MKRRSWRWLRSRIESLGDRPGTFVQFNAPDGDEKLAFVPSTRLGIVMNPPEFK